MSFGAAAFSRPKGSTGFETVAVSSARAADLPVRWPSYFGVDVQVLVAPVRRAKLVLRHHL